MSFLNGSVLALLACPACRQSLTLEHTAPHEAILCQGCGRRYPIVDGIPVLIEERSHERSKERVAP